MTCLNDATQTVDSSDATVVVEEEMLCLCKSRNWKVLRTGLQCKVCLSKYEWRDLADRVKYWR